MYIYGSSVFLFFKQKTAYEMRISDWSSDVCSSDLVAAIEQDVRAAIAAGDYDYALWSLIDTGHALSKAMPNGALLPGNDGRLAVLCLEFVVRKRGVMGKSGSGRVDHVGRRLLPPNNIDIYPCIEVKNTQYAI